LNERETDAFNAIFAKKIAASFTTLQGKRGLEAKLKNPKAKCVNFELLGVNSFGMSGNFTFSEDFYNYLKNNFKVNYDKSTKLWVFTPLEVYN
jgi:hypothetical protein